METSTETGMVEPLNRTYLTHLHARREMRKPALFRLSPDLIRQLERARIYEFFSEADPMTELFGVPLDVTSGQSHLLCDDGAMIPVPAQVK